MFCPADRIFSILHLFQCSSAAPGNAILKRNNRALREQPWERLPPARRLPSYIQELHGHVGIRDEEHARLVS